MEAGLAPDQADINLPDGIFTDLRNFRFRDGSLEKCSGNLGVFGSLSATAIWLNSITDGTNIYWVYGNEAVLYATDGTTHTQINSASYNATLDLGYTGGPFQGYMVLNDSVTYPQSWSPNPANKVIPLANWPASVYCKVIRPYDNFLVALRITQGGTYNPRMLRWSDAAAEGALPGSWDYADPTNQAGITELGDTQDELIDCLPLRSVNVIYKQNSTWLMEPVGGLDVFGFRQLFGQSGLLTEDCVKAIGAQHVLATDSDLIAHDGGNITSLVSQKLRRWLFNQIDTTYYRRSFMVADYREREMWFCFPESGNAFANLAVVWSWVNGKVWIRELGASGELMSCGASGIIGNAAVTWASDTGTWETDDGAWDEANYSPTAQRLLLARSGSKLAYQSNTGSSWNGSDMTCYAHRNNMALTKDVGRVKEVKAIYPKVYGTAYEVLTVRVGVAETLIGAVAWDTTRDFTIGIDYKIDCRPRAGRFVSVQFGYTGSGTVRIAGFDVEFDHGGKR